jgi:biopolymer transport protein ExbB
MHEMFVKGGLVMWPLLACSIVAAAVIVERLVVLFKLRRIFRETAAAILRLVGDGRQADAADICEKKSDLFFMPIFAAGLRKTGHPKREIKEAVTETAEVELGVLEKRLGLLATIAHISPLLGLLGTVTGMIAAFQQIQKVSQAGMPVAPGHLAAGIWEALITTVAGLIIAIPAYLAYNYFVSFTNSFIGEIEKAATHFVELLVQLKKPGPSAPRPSRTAIA